MTDEIHIKVSGTAVYKAVKQYLDNSPEFKDQIKQIVDKLGETTIKNRVDSLVRGIERDVIYKTRTELDLMIKKEVEAKVAAYISKGIQNMFEGTK